MPGFARPLMKAGTGFSHFMFRLLGDRMKVQGRPLLMLKTEGAKTGKERHSIVARFEDPGHPGAWLVVGSAGASGMKPVLVPQAGQEPGPGMGHGGQGSSQGRSRVLARCRARRGVEADRSLAPNFGKYERTTDRLIPVIRLTPETGA